MSWDVNRHTARCTSPVSVVWQCKLVSGWGLRKRRSAPLYGPYGSGRIVLVLLLSLLLSDECCLMRSWLMIVTVEDSQLSLANHCTPAAHVTCSRDCLLSMFSPSCYFSDSLCSRLNQSEANAKCSLLSFVRDSTSVKTESHKTTSFEE